MPYVAKVTFVAPDGDGRKTVFPAGRPVPDDVAVGRERLLDELEGHVCGVCGFEAKTAAGLGAHGRRHDSDGDG